MEKPDTATEALLERVDKTNPDIVGLVKLVRSLQADRKQVEWMRRYFIRKQDSGQRLAIDETAIGALIEQIRPRLDEPWIRQLVVMLEIQTIALRKAYARITELENSDDTEN
jgi:hypothetical protein